MRRYNPEYSPVVLPSDLNGETFKTVCFTFGDQQLHLPPYLLFATPSVFVRYKDDFDGVGLGALLELARCTATSTKAFDVVFQPLLYGYLDIEEINRKNKFNHQPFNLLVDGLILANKIRADSVMKLLQEELRDTYGRTAISVDAISKLFEGLPMTKDFFIRYVLRAGSSAKGRNILEKARRQIHGFAEFEDTDVEEVALQEIEQARDSSVKATESIKQESLPAGIPVDQLKPSAAHVPRDVAKFVPSYQDDSPVKVEMPTTVDMKSPLRSEQHTEASSASAQLLHDLDTATTNVSVEVPAVTVTASAQKAKRGRPKAVPKSRKVLQPRQRARTSPASDPPTKEDEADPGLMADNIAEPAADASTHTQPTASEPVDPKPVLASELKTTPATEATQPTEPVTETEKSKRVTNPSKVAKPAPITKKTRKAPAKASTKLPNKSSTRPAESVPLNSPPVEVKVDPSTRRRHPSPLSSEVPSKRKRTVKQNVAKRTAIEASAQEVMASDDHANHADDENEGGNNSDGRAGIETEAEAEAMVTAPETKQSEVPVAQVISARSAAVKSRAGKANTAPTKDIVNVVVTKQPAKPKVGKATASRAPATKATDKSKTKAEDGAGAITGTTTATGAAKDAGEGGRPRRVIKKVDKYGA